MEEVPMSSSTKAGAGQDRFVSGEPGTRRAARRHRALSRRRIRSRSTTRSGPSTGNLGDSQCYLGVTAKVDAIQAALAARIRRDDLPVRLIAPAYTIGVSDGQLNGTDRMRYSLIGRELANDSHRRAPERERGEGPDRRRRVRQAAGRHARGRPRAQRAGGVPFRRLDQARASIRRAASASTWSRRSRWRAIPTPRRARAWRSTPAPDRAAAAGMFTYNTMQIVHRRARHGAAAHGRAAVRRSAPSDASSPSSSSTASSR